MIYITYLKNDYFNRINFREINSHDFANFCFEIKTRENAWGCWLPDSRKLNPLRNFWNRIFGEETSQTSPFVAKNDHFQLALSLIREIKSRKFRDFFCLEKFNLTKFNLIKVYVCDVTSVLCCMNQVPSLTQRVLLFRDGEIRKN